MGNALLDLLFPPRCAACDALSPEPFCPTCAQSLYEVVSPLCPRCGVPFDGGVDHLCADCAARPPAFGRARASFRYGGELQRALLLLKFGGREDLARRLARLMPAAPPADLIVPVPLSRRRLIEREYNQALLLARAWRRLGATAATVDPWALRRVVDTPPQASLRGAARRRALRGAFLADARRVESRRVLLVDDVLTTGATAGECARALLRAGAAGVDVVTLARTVL